MKRMLVLVLLAVLLLPVFVLAEYNLAGMTDEELLILNKELIAELLNRKKSALLPPGWYVVGEEIPEGTYILTLDPIQQAGFEKHILAYIYQYESQEKYLADRYQGYFHMTAVYDNPSSNSKVVLTKGQVLTVEQVNVYMQQPPQTIEFK